MDLEAAWTALRIFEDDVGPGHIFKSDAARLLKTSARRIEQVDDGSTARMHVKRGLAEDGQLLDRERPRDRPLRRAHPRYVERLAEVHAVMPNERSAAVPPRGLPGALADPRCRVRLPVSRPSLDHLSVVLLGPG
jgi:hypothetical protein